MRLCETHDTTLIPGFSGVNEKALYNNLDWLCKHQEQIEEILWLKRSNKKMRQLFLYDVTSSYLEGEYNELSAYGYNRDKKKGTKQIVIGLLSDESGDPVAIRVFAGNTNDTRTFAS